MIYLRVVQIMLVSATILGGIGAFNISMYGPQMCRHFCCQIGNCFHPMYATRSLTCYLSNIRDSENADQDGVYKLEMTRESIENRSVKGSRRIITSRRGKPVAVSLEAKSTDTCYSTISQISEERRLKSRNVPKVAFNLTTPPDMKKLRCFLFSMAVSKSNPTLLYMLLQCEDASGCQQKLHVVDLRTQQFPLRSIDFCEEQNIGDRQIFTGPCANNRQTYCLYSINSGRRLYITVYKEPSLMAEQLDKVERKEHVRRKVSSFLCSNYKLNRLLCFHDGRQFYYASMYLRLRPENWTSQRFPGIRDFNTLNNKARFNAVFLQESLVTIVTIDFDRKTVHIERTVDMEADFVTFIDGYMLLHKRQLEEQFNIIEINPDWCQA